MAEFSIRGIFLQNCNALLPLPNVLSVCTGLQYEPNVQQYTFCRMNYEELKLMHSKNFDKKRCHTVIASARHLLPLPSLHNWGWCYISSAKLGLLGQAWRHVHHHVTVIYMAAKFLLTGCFWQEKVSTYCHRCSEGFILIKKEKRGRFQKKERGRKWEEIRAKPKNSRNYD